ncbi:MAG: hypothetical protein ABSA77_07815 [Thermoguttaceae bacterium]
MSMSIAAADASLPGHVLAEMELHDSARSLRYAVCVRRGGPARYQGRSPESRNSM